MIVHIIRVAQKIKPVLACASAAAAAPSLRPGLQFAKAGLAQVQYLPDSGCFRVRFGRPQGEGDDLPVLRIDDNGGRMQRGLLDEGGQGVDRRRHGGGRILAGRDGRACPRRPARRCVARRTETEMRTDERTHRRAAKGIDDGREAGATPQEAVHAGGVAPEIERRVGVAGRAGDALLPHEIGLQPEIGIGVGGVPSAGDPVADDGHVVVCGQGDLVLHGVHGASP